VTEHDTIRLNKHLALQLGISRREADELIKREQVTINDRVAPLGARFRIGNQIAVKGNSVKVDTKFQYLMLNKPVGYVHSLKPVGRLDKNSSGLILLTNDGDFAYQMTHPKFVKVKIYKVLLDHDLEPLHQQMISDYGVTLEDGPSKLSLERLSEHNRKEWQVTMSEGRNRQIRRTLGSLGYEVKKLHRTNFGNYSLDQLKAGQWSTINLKK
jgi:23S rRNA pseudouridine2605 synthase